MVPPPGLRERRKSETRRAISEVALHLALERGPEKMTVEDIAAAVGVSPRTVFNYFRSKDEAILGVDPEQRAELRDLVVARDEQETPLEALAAVLVWVATTRGDAGRSWRDRSRLVARHPRLRAALAASQEALEQDLADAVGARTGLGGDHPYCRLAAAAVLAVSRHALSDPETRSNATLRRRMEEGFAALTRGLTPPGGSRP